MRRLRSSGCRLGNAIVTCAGVMGLVAPASAGVVSYRLGEQDFPSGAAPILVTDARAAGANEPFPFDGSVFGDDRTPSFGKIAFGYSLASGPPVLGATLTMGLLGLDSPPGSKPTVKLFLDGIRQPNEAFAGASAAGERSSASVVSVPVPTHLLADGMLDVMVKSFRHGPGYPGNAIAADFSSLTIVDISRPPGGGTGDGTDGASPGSDNGGIPGDTDGPGGPGDGGTTPPGGGGVIDPPGGGIPGGGIPGGGIPGGGIPGGGIPGEGGAGGQPVPAVPLPPAAILGGIGLVVAALMRRRV